MKKPGTMPAIRQSAARRYIAASEKRSVSCALLAAGVRGTAQEGDAESAHEAGSRERSRQRQQRADRRHQQFQAPRRQLRTEQNGLEGEPFGDEPVERRQRGNRHAANEKHEGRLRHAVDQAAETLHVALTGGVEHGAGAKKQQALEQRMIENVKQSGGERQSRSERKPFGFERQRKSERGKDDADVLDGAVGEDAFEIALHQARRARPSRR